MFKCVLFDLDGTLIDHVPAIHRTYAHTMGQLGLPVPTEDAVRRAIGGGSDKTLEGFVGASRLTDAIKIYREFWDRTMLQGVSLLPGARDLIERLFANEVRMAVLTNKFGVSSRQLCDHLGISRYFELIVGSKDTPWLKPDPQIAAFVLQKLSVLPTDCCLIGDSPWDIETAHNGGFKCYAVATGSHSLDELKRERAEGVYENLVELGNVVFPR